MKILYKNPESETATRSQIALLQKVVDVTQGLRVGRRHSARSRVVFPSSNDLESVLVDPLEGLGFQHHRPITHPRTQEGYEYDFFEPSLGLAVEIMGYRADDEIYKDILKFHVDARTKVGAVLVPRWKWIGEDRTETNLKATLKALEFANSYMNVGALVALVYDWSPASHQKWGFTYVEAR
jgi:hypothetical protein